MTSQILAIVAPLFMIIGVGYLYGLKSRPQMRITNQLIMDVFMPALILGVMIGDGFQLYEYFNLMLAGALLMLISGLLAYPVARLFAINWRSFVPPAMFSNWANLGVPLYVFALGEAALGAGIMLAVTGNILLFTLGSYIYSGRVSLFEVLKTPIILSVVLGLAINLLGLNLPSFLVRSIELLGQVVIPLMLFSLGVRLTMVTLSNARVGVLIGLYCPIVGVALACLLTQFVPLSPLHQSILILFGVLPPAVVNFILAEQYGAEPDKVASMVLFGNLFAVFSLPAVIYLLTL